MEADIVISGPLSPLPIGEKHSLYPLPSKALDPYCLLDDADPAPTIPPYLLRMEELKTLFEQRTKSGPTSQLQGSMEVLADLIDFYLLTQKNQSI